MRRARLAIPLLGLALVAAVHGPPAPASADTASDTQDIVRFAAIEASRWSEPATGYDELRAGPGAVRDDDRETAWETYADAHGDAWLLLDWTSADPAPLSFDELVVGIEPADAPLSLEVGLERTRLERVDATITRSADAAHLRVPGDARFRAMRLHVPPGARVASVAVRARSTAPERAPSASGSCDREGVHLAIDARGSVGLRITRRDAEGRTLEIVRRETAASRFDDPSVRFRPRPATYVYEIASLLPRGQASVSITCEGEATPPPSTTALHGVVEGFYGRPWPARDRAKIVRAMGALGLDPYVYAPKDAQKHRARWRDRYDEAELEAFHALARVGEASGVRVVYAISPGLDVDAASSADRDALAAKVADVRKGAGVRDAALLMDDIVSPPSTTLGQAHASLAQTLLASMRADDPAAKLLFVPTVYAGAASSLGQDKHDYLGALASLPPDVPLAWTGTATFSPSYDRAELEAFAQLASRTAAGAWVWDNYPVNDALATGRLYARPVEGRSALMDRTGGFLANAMRHPIASIATRASFGALARDPAGYDAARAAKQPLAETPLARALMDDGDPPPALETLLDELTSHPFLWPDATSPALAAAIARYDAASAPGKEREAAALDLATRLARLAVVDVDLRRELHDASLADELDGYARVIAVAARAALAAMTGDRSGQAASRSEGACLLAGIRQRSWQTIQPAMAKLIPKADPAECPVLDDPFDPVRPTPIAPGRLARFDASSLAGMEGGRAARWSLVGPDGAAIDQAGQVSFTPARPGRYRIVALYGDPRGAAARILDVAVGELPPPPPDAEGGCACRAAPPARTTAGAAVLAVLSAMVVREGRRGGRHRRR